MRMHLALVIAISFVPLVQGTNLSPAKAEPKDSHPSFSYEVARSHEIKPHRRTMPMKGIGQGFNQLHLTLTVSPTGDVTDADATAEHKLMELWPKLEAEVLAWKFIPFEKDGKPTTAEVEEYLDLVPPERLPQHHVQAPALNATSKVSITLKRSGCFGDCPAYSVTVSTEGLSFEGGSIVSGKHTESIDADEVRALAKRFVNVDFYSMDSSYTAGVTDNPTYSLSITIDGQAKTVRDYVGSWVGMPAVVTELEDAVDELARTRRWIEAEDGLVDALSSEKFDFHSQAGQSILKAAALRGKTNTVRELLQAGVPLLPLPPSKQSKKKERGYYEGIGWLTAASAYPDMLQLLINSGASKNDSEDKVLALVGAARSGKIDGVRALLAYGADPNADLTSLTITEQGGGMSMTMPGSGSVLFYAAESGNPEVVREILKYHPKLEVKDHEGKTALFAAGDYRYDVEDEARVECVQLLVRAGANVNARDEEGNTPLHETFLTEVEEELLKLGADVNARNNDGETPIFTTVDDSALELFIDHGADLNIRNNKGQSVFEAAKEKGEAREKALREAIDKSRAK